MLSAHTQNMCVGVEVLTTVFVVNTLQYIHVSNHHIVHFKLIYMSMNLNKTGKINITNIINIIIML